MIAKLQKLINEYPNLTGDELHCANCIHVKWCVEDFGQPSIDPEHKRIRCKCFRFWPRCSVCNNRMEERRNDWWMCADHPTADIRLR